MAVILRESKPGPLLAAGWSMALVRNLSEDPYDLSLRFAESNAGPLTGEVVLEHRFAPGSYLGRFPVTVLMHLMDDFFVHQLGYRGAPDYGGATTIEGHAHNRMMARQGPIHLHMRYQSAQFPPATSQSETSLEDRLSGYLDSLEETYRRVAPRKLDGNP